MSAINLDLNLDNKDANQALNEIIGGFTKLKKVSDDSLSSIDKQTKNTFNSSKIKGSTGSLSKLGNAFSILKKGITPVAIGLGVVTGAAIGLGAAFLALARDQQKIQNLEQLYKGSPEALQRMKVFAQNAGIEFETATEAILKLGRAFKPKDAEELLKVIGDLRAKAKLDSSGVANLTDEIAELGGKVNVGNSDFEKFQKLLGSNIFKIDDIAKASGMSIKDVQKQIKEGTLSTVDFAAALRLAGLNGAKAGEGALKDAPKSIESQLNRIESIWENFKSNIFKGFGGEGVAIDALTKVGDTLEKIAGSKIVADIMSDLGKAMKFLLENAKPIGIALFVLMAPLTALPTALFILYRAFKDFDSVKQQFIDGIDSIKNIVINAFTAIPEMIGFALGTIFKHFLKLPEYAVIAFEGLKTVFKEIGPFITNTILPIIKELPAQFITIGSQIMDGLYKGLLSGIGKITEVISTVVNSIKKGFTSALQIQSPSKVFEQYGSYSGEGYAEGLNKSNALVENESSKLATNSKDALSKEQKEQLKALTDIGSDSGNSNLSMMPKQKPINNSSINNTNKTVNNTPNIIINIEAGANVDQTLVDELKNTLAPKIANAYKDLMSRATAAGAL